MQFEGKTVLITGGGRGIGAATAQRFAEQGANVVLASRTTEEMNAVIAHATDRMRAIQTDLSNPNSIDQLFEQLDGKLDILVNNAGAATLKPILEWTLADWEYMSAVNIRAVWLCCQWAFRLMNESGGAIVNVSSLAGLQNTAKFPGFAAYSATKHAVTGLTEALAVEGKPKNIRVNAVAPGAVATRMLKEAAPWLEASWNPVDIAEIILFLAHHSKLTGTVCPVFSND